MNAGFYKDLDTNFEQAYKLCNTAFTHDELLELLKHGNIPQKQIAALQFDFVKTENDAEMLASVLTGCDGKIREAAALRIYQLITKSPETGYFFAKLPADIFASATIDINANICRMVVDSVKQLKKYEDFSKVYSSLILEYTTQALDELDKFIFRDKKYVINKQLFKLYWCLEALKFFYDFVDVKTFQSLLKRSALQDEYTVREKTAQISVFSDDFSEIQELLKNDKNYYVRAVFQR